MRAFKNKGTRTRACSYCRNHDHTATECKQAELDYLEWKAYRVPHKSPMWYTWLRYDYTKWEKECERIADMRYKAEQRKNNPTTRAPRSCGFCKDSGHTRRNCPEMQEVLSDAYKANQNWRKSFYKRFVKEMGISEGAAISVAWNGGWRQPEKTGIGLVTEINWDKLSFLAAPKHLDYDYRTHLEVTVLIDGQQKRLTFSDGLMSNDSGLNRTLLHHMYHHNGVTYVETIGRAEKELDESWASEGMKDEFAWLTKSRTWERLDDLGILKAIRAWL